jgi:predicted DNA-binding transcriptional regulator AlpA
MIGVDQSNVKRAQPETPCLSMRPKEAAKALGISERLLWEWTNRGIVPHIRIGGVIIYPADSLRKWLQRQAEKVQDAADNESGKGA